MFQFSSLIVSTKCHHVNDTMTLFVPTDNAMSLFTGSKDLNLVLTHMGMINYIYIKIILHYSSTVNKSLSSKFLEENLGKPLTVGSTIVTIRYCFDLNVNIIETTFYYRKPKR